jgi:hypothetical protein
MCLPDDSRFCIDIQFERAAARLIPLVEADQQLGCAVVAGVNEVLKFFDRSSFVKHLRELDLGGSIPTVGSRPQAFFVNPLQLHMREPRPGN